MGCQRDSQNDVVEEGDTVEEDEISEDFSYLTEEDLRLQLSEAIMIELKNTDNDVIGGITEREEITSLVEKIFSYHVEDTIAAEDANKEIIGPINFYFNDGESYFGLVKENHIFIEGYYFRFDSSQLEDFVEVFSVLEEPVGDNP